MRVPPDSPARAASPARLARWAIKTALLILAAAAAAALSVAASALGLSLVLVLGAISAFMLLRIRQRTLGRLHDPYLVRRAMVAAGLAVIEFFMLATVVAAYWPR